jgi:hypothetical protein
VVRAGELSDPLPFIRSAGCTLWFLAVCFANDSLTALLSARFYVGSHFPRSGWKVSAHSHAIF